MKKTKLISLLLAVTMMILFSVPVVTANYDPTQPIDPPADVWTISGVYHWVVRGESLDDIAEFYGTYPEEIILKNPEYFADLARRNRTTGLNVRLEHGVRLFIYHMATVVHYVQRGDTLEDFALNGYFTRGLFVLRTTTADIIRQNQNWFNNLAALNATRGTNHTLEESYAMWSVPNNTTIPYNNPFGMDRILWSLL